MFHVSKWGDISLNNPLKSKKINNFVQARPVWLGRAFHFEFPRVFHYLCHNILLTHNILYKCLDEFKRNSQLKSVMKQVPDDALIRKNQC